MTMQEFLMKVPDYIQVAGVIFMFVSVLATVLVRVAAFLAKMTPETSDDEKVARAAEVVKRCIDGFLNLMMIFPTLGKNPRTKQMEQAYQQLKEEKQDEPKAAS